MEQYSTRTINNTVLKALNECMNTNDALSAFLMMKMSNDLGKEDGHSWTVPSLSEINVNLVGNGVLDSTDFGIKNLNGFNFTSRRLFVNISANCTLYIENTGSSLIIKVNDTRIGTMIVRGYSGGNLALWLIRQKQQFDGYIDEWNEVVKKVAKKAKGNHMAMLAIKAIFSDEMKQYPGIEYEFVEQQRRLRIKVRLPNSRLLVFLNAWWRSYQKTLPQQIEDLKILIEAHNRVSLTDFFVSHK